MADQTNRHPADRLHDVRAAIRALEQEEEQLRRYILAHEADRVGDHYVAELREQSRTRYDMPALIKMIGADLADRFTQRFRNTVIRLRPRIDRAA